MVCAAPLYSTIKLQVSPLGMAGSAVFAVCKVPVPLVDVGLPLSKKVLMLNVQLASMVSIPLTVTVDAEVFTPPLFDICKLAYVLLCTVCVPLRLYITVDPLLSVPNVGVFASVV